MNHFYFNIQGWFHFSDVYDRAVAMAVDGMTFVEVGCWKGRSTAYMAVSILNSRKNIKFDVVDTFEGSKDHAEKGIDCSNLFNQFVENVSPAKHAIRHIRHEPSIRAATRYEDGSLDFVFLDASHEKDDVKADILAWQPKLKPTGVLAGDDLPWESVQNALKELGHFVNGNPGVTNHDNTAWLIVSEEQQAWVTPREETLGKRQGSQSK